MWTQMGMAVFQENFIYKKRGRGHMCPTGCRLAIPIRWTAGLNFSLPFIHSGKFGQVFRLVEKKTGKIWAGKFFKAYSAKEKENIRQEISIMNCLHHPKLVQCVDAFEEKANIVMVLEM